MSQSIQSPTKPPRRAPCVAQHRRRAGVLTVQAIRRFPTLEKASAYLARRAKVNTLERFAIQQTELHTWTVCRIIAGGVL